MPEDLSRNDILELLQQHEVIVEKDISNADLEKLFNEHIGNMIQEDDVEELEV